MKKFVQHAKSAFHHDGDNHGPGGGFPGGHQSQQPMNDQPSSIQAPTPSDVVRYRYQHGCNLGSVFVLEKWLTGGMYQKDSQSAELAAVTGNVKALGLDGARQKHEQHWNNYVSDGDLDWLMNVAHCNSVRIPIGYFTLGPAYCHDTPFSQVSDVYVNAWAAVKKLVGRCFSKGIGCLLDLHALPGGANGGDHSGTNSGKAQFWGSSSNREAALRCLLFIAKEAKNMDGVLGIQLCNEAEWNAKDMYKWYDSTIAQMGSIDNTMPLYISDAWQLGQAVSYINGKNSLHAGRANPVVIDTHFYWIFSDKDKKMTPQQIIQEVPSKMSVLDGHEGSVVDHGAAQVVVGEYSCVMSEESWGKVGLKDKPERGDLTKEFGVAQTKRYQERAGGSFYWTYRMDWMDGGGWGFKQQTKTGAIKAPHEFALPHDDVQSRVQNAQAQQQDRQQAAMSGHCNYWDQNHPGDYEHHRFEQGWQVGYQDAAAFFGMKANGGLAGKGGDKIGMLDIWVKKRIVESGQAGKFLWEFETGLRQGVRDFYAAAGI